MSKRHGTVPKKSEQIIMRKTNFDSWVAFYKGKYGSDLLQWPPHVREWYRSVSIVGDE